MTTEMNQTSRCELLRLSQDELTGLELIPQKLPPILIGLTTLDPYLAYAQTTA